MFYYSPNEYFLGCRYGLSIPVVIVLSLLVANTSVKCTVAPYVDIVLEWTHTVDDGSNSGEDYSPELSEEVSSEISTEVSEPEYNHANKPGNVTKVSFLL